MTDFFSRLAGRVRGDLPLAAPRLPSLYEGRGWLEPQAAEPRQDEVRSSAAGTAKAGEQEPRPAARGPEVRSIRKRKVDPPAGPPELPEKVASGALPAPGATPDGEREPRGVPARARRAPSAGARRHRESEAGRGRDPQSRPASRQLHDPPRASVPLESSMPEGAPAAAPPRRGAPVAAAVDRPESAPVEPRREATLPAPFEPTAGPEPESIVPALGARPVPAGAKPTPDRARDGALPETTVRVTIGSIVVRAAGESPGPKPSRRPPAPQRLEDYLDRRGGRRS